MQQKITWMRYLLTGISLITLSALISCEIQDAHNGPINVKVVYFNETDSGIKYFQYHKNGQKIPVFEIDPMGTYEMDIEAEYDTSKELDLETCCTGIFEGFQGRGDVLIEFDNNQCVLFESGEGPTTQNIDGYTSSVTSVVKGINSVQFSYSFTSIDMQNAENCE